MTIRPTMTRTFFAALCIFTALSANSYAKLNPRQESLRGVRALAIDITCSQDGKEAGLTEEELTEAVREQLEQAGLKVMPRNLWGRVPGRCQLKAIVQLYEPSGLETFIYNIRLHFVQTATLERSPETTVDATTWDLTWLAHSSKERLAEAIAENLEIMADSFIKDYRAANPQPRESSAADTSDSAALPSDPAGVDKESEAVANEFVASKSSTVFHKPDCRWAKNISAANLVTYRSRDEAAKDGKRPCKSCKP
ncbi:MAG: hypothetical protein JSW66_13045 [Phycisphaerales bacterium]|nr:MAG: hypothetical protein JSW66_13045 [Phycisphaerales bacterium]